MKKLFHLEHPLWKMMSFLTDCMILTLIWVLFSLPIITIGPSLVALFHVGISINQQIGKGVIHEFIRVFLKKFKSSFYLGMVVLLLAIIIGVDVWYFYSNPSALSTFLLFSFIFMAVLFSSVLLYVFPLMAKFDWKISKIIKLAFYMAIRHLKWTSFLFILNASMIFVTIYVAPYLFFFSIGALAYLNTKVVLMLLEENDYHAIIATDN